MGDVFSSAGQMSGIGPLANAQDYTKALGVGMGPVASGEQYGQFLQSQQPGLFDKLGTGLEKFGEYNKAFGELMPKQQQLQPLQFMQSRQPIQLQSTDLLALLRNLGGIQ